jgi:hypothetical protein
MTGIIITYAGEIVKVRGRRGTVGGAARVARDSASGVRPRRFRASFLLNMVVLGEVVSSAQQLNVLCHQGRPTLGKGYDMIEMQIVSTRALDALPPVPLPDGELDLRRNHPVVG